jgi:hypothetical protein
MRHDNPFIREKEKEKRSSSDSLRNVSNYTLLPSIIGDVFLAIEKAKDRVGL